MNGELMASILFIGAMMTAVVILTIGAICAARKADEADAELKKIADDIRERYDDYTINPWDPKFDKYSSGNKEKCQLKKELKVMLEIDNFCRGCLWSNECVCAYESDSERRETCDECVRGWKAPDKCADCTAKIKYCAECGKSEAKEDEKSEKSEKGDRE